MFGSPYPILFDFLGAYPERGALLDLGCGQGRDAIALARLGYEVTGIDNSKVGIEQMNQVARKEILPLTGQVGDIFAFEDYATFDFVLLDSMFHFAKKDKKKEVAFIENVISKIKKGCLLIVCIQDTGNKVKVLEEAIHSNRPLVNIADESFTYVFEDKENGHQSETNYRLVVVKK